MPGPPEDYHTNTVDGAAGYERWRSTQAGDCDGPDLGDLADAHEARRRRFGGRIRWTGDPYEDYPPDEGDDWDD
jgi:hypothetical protein